MPDIQLSPALCYFCRSLEEFRGNRFVNIAMELCNARYLYALLLRSVQASKEQVWLISGNCNTGVNKC